MYNPPTGVHVGQDRRDPSHVVRRHANQGSLVLAGSHELHRAEDVGDQVPVAQHRRLRLASGSAGEQQHRGLLAVHYPVGLGPQAADHLFQEVGTKEDGDSFPADGSRPGRRFHDGYRRSYPVQ